MPTLNEYIYEYSERNRTGADIPVYSVTNTRGFCKGYFDKDVASSNRSSYKIVPYGFFAYNPSRINVGSIAWQDKEEKAIVSPLYVVFGIDEEKVRQDYLMYYLKSPAVNHRINAFATGTVRMNLKFSVLSEFPFKAPSLDEQKNIVFELDLLSGVIDKQKAQLKELDNLAQSTFYDMFGDPIENPKEWKLKRLDECGSISSGGTPSRKNADYFKGDIDWYSAGELNTLFLAESLEKITKQALEESSAKLFPANSLFIGMYDTAAFKLGITQKPASSNQACANFSSNSTNVVYLYYLLSLVRYKVLNDRHGARQKNLSVGYIKNLTLPIAPFDLQQSFADKIASIEKQKAALTQSIAETQKLLAYTMDKYFG